MSEEFKVRLNTIIHLAKMNKIVWSKHILIKMQQRDITIKQITECLQVGVIIEFYPDDYPYPSFLVLGWLSSNKPLHVVCAIGEDMLWMITAYYPSDDEWHDNYRTRRGKP